MQRNLFSRPVFSLFVFSLLSLFSCNLNNRSPLHDKTEGIAGKDSPVPLILDTDIAEDYDDVGAMAMMHALADRGELKILAVMSSNKNELVAPTIDVLNTWFGRPDIPVGAPKNEGLNRSSNELGWPDSLIKYYPHKLKSTEDAFDAVRLYRKILSAQPDRSVTIVTVGFLTNMRDLLVSGPDRYSDLDGKQLVKKKVRHWVAMAGVFPEGKEYNVMMDSTASKYAIDNWPTPIFFSGFEIGVHVLTGLRLINEGPADSPVRMAYEISIGKRPEDRNGRMSWDQTALLVAVRGVEPWYDSERGRFITFGDGSNAWEADPAGKHLRLIARMPPDSVAAEIEYLMMQH